MIRDRLLLLGAYFIFKNTMSYGRIFLFSLSRMYTLRVRNYESSNFRLILATPFLSAD